LSNQHKTYRPTVKGDMDRIRAAIELMANAKRPVFYTGGGVINSGPHASTLLRELVHLTGFPITSTLMGLGAYPASDKQSSACSGCTAPTRLIWRCMNAT
jgi:acetolactate synthase-1/2/3 large subunit